MKSRGWAAPTALAVLIVAILAGAGWLATRGDDGGSSAGRPVVLHLSSSGSGADVAMASEVGDGAGGGGGGAAYRLVGDLPSDRPDDQAVYRLRTATADDAAQVADALELSGTATRVDGGWVLRDGDNRLVVRDDGGWSYGLDCAPDTPVSSEDISVGCAVASSGGVAVAESSDPGAAGGPDPCNPDSDDCVVDPPLTKPSPLPQPTFAPGPSESEARAAAATILDRLGLGDATTTVWAGDPVATVQAQPRLAGLQTFGWTTSLQIDGSGQLVSGDGWVTDPEIGADYPVVSAQRAFELLQDQPRMMMELCAQRPDGKPGCADIPPAEVTGATLGLQLDYDGRRAVLVPAWLFDVRDQPEPAVQIAVDPSFLGTPPTPLGAPAEDTPTQVEPVPADTGTSP
jgi:hypothetical protein